MNFASFPGQERSCSCSAVCSPWLWPAQRAVWRGAGGQGWAAEIHVQGQLWGGSVENQVRDWCHPENWGPGGGKVRLEQKNPEILSETCNRVPLTWQIGFLLVLCFTYEGLSVNWSSYYKNSDLLVWKHYSIQTRLVKTFFFILSLLPFQEEINSALARCGGGCRSC